MTSTTPTVVNDNSKGFVSKLFEMDTDTKNGLMNGIQYIVMAVIPVAIVDQITKNFFGTKDPSDKGSMELLAEVLGQAVITLVLLFMVHKLIIAVPTYTGTPMTRINYSTISLGFLVTMYAIHPGIADRVDILFTRLQDAWEGKSDDSKNGKRGKDKSKVSVSQPISGSRQAMPTHQVSRADYINQQNAMMPVQSQPPIVPRQQQQMPQQQPQNEPAQGQAMYGGPSNTLIGAQEPMAANAALGGGGWSAW